MLLVLVVSAIAQVGIFAWLLTGWLKWRPLGDPPAHIPISIIVAAHNEESNLRNNLPLVLDQARSARAEVIVVLDRCTDGSLSELEEMQARFECLRILELSETAAGWSSKKYALQLGINAASHEHIALTDADCRPGRDWLKGLGSAFARGNDLVIGIGPYVRQPGFLNLLVRFETMMTAVMYAGLAFWRLPYMAVGRNIGYTKSFFQRAGGFGSHAGKLSGDDDLLVNCAGRSAKIGLLLAEETRVYSFAEKTWRAWISQKIRHGSAGKSYSLRSLLILSLVHGLHLIFYVSLMFVLCMHDALVCALAVYLGRMAVMQGMLCLIRWKDKIGLLAAFPLLDFIYLIYLTLLVPALAFTKPNWKGR